MSQKRFSQAYRSGADSTKNDGTRSILDPVIERKSYTFWVDNFYQNIFASLLKMGQKENNFILLGLKKYKVSTYVFLVMLAENSSSLFSPLNPFKPSVP